MAPGCLGDRFWGLDCAGVCLSSLLFFFFCKSGISFDWLLMGSRGRVWMIGARDSIDFGFDLFV